MTATATIKEGDRVRCKAPSIDHKVGEGEFGVVIGFARFSSYHTREALVKLESDESHWFWLGDLEASA